MPNFRFLNSARLENHKDLTNKELIGIMEESLQNDKLGYITTDKVIILDDFISSGGSLNNASEVIQMFFPKVKKIYASAYSTGNMTYDLDHLKGVSDMPVNSDRDTKIKYAGGYLSVPYSEDVNDNSRELFLLYRYLIREVVKSYINEIKKNKESKEIT